MPLMAFAIYAVIVVMLDYLLIILILPTYYIFHEKYVDPLFSWSNLASRIFCCQHKKMQREDVIVIEKATDLEDLGDDIFFQNKPTDEYGASEHMIEMKEISKKCGGVVMNPEEVCFQLKEREKEIWSMEFPHDHESGN